MASRLYSSFVTGGLASGGAGLGRQSSLDGLEAAGHSRFRATSLMQPQGLFGVVHYAGEVTYDTNGFLAKNRDEVPKEAVDVFRGSSLEFVRTLFDAETDTGHHSLFQSPG